MKTNKRETSITFLGTSSVIPEPGRDTVCFVINQNILVDTGWCSVLNMGQYGLNPLELDYLLFTHFHHDHYLALPQLLFFFAMHQRQFSEKKRLTIIGPEQGLRKIVDRAIKFLQMDNDKYANLRFPLETVPLRPGQSFDGDDFHLETRKARHDIQGLCYRFTDRKTDVTLTYTGDTAADDEIASFAKGGRLLIHDCAYGADGTDRNHSNAIQASEIAKKAEVNQLALVHYDEKNKEQIALRAKEIFPNTIVPSEGEVLHLSV